MAIFRLTRVIESPIMRLNYWAHDFMEFMRYSGRNSMNHFIYRKKRKILLAAISMGVLAASISAFHGPEAVYAYTATAGTINDGPVKVRNAPVTGDKLTLLYPGNAVTVTDETAGSDGYTWCQIQMSDGVTGYIRSDFVTLQGTDSSAGQTNADSSAGGTNGVVQNTEKGVYVRSGAGTSYSVVTKVYKGQAVKLVSAGGMNWYSVTLVVGGASYSGWICADYVAVNGQTSDDQSQGETTGATDSEYEAALAAAGFPASYCSALASLHQKYPNWQFVPVQTGLDWNTVVSNESLVGRNLIQNSVNDARKSTDSQAYNWETNKWYGFDGASWVSASPEYIAYCIDPRNFLNENQIFQFETLEYAGYQNAAGVQSVLSNTFMAGNYTDTDGAVRSYADTFVEIGSNVGVSPYHLASRCKQEQGVRGTSDLISGRYSNYAGYYNYFNVRAFTTGSASAIVNGLEYAKLQGWNSIYKSIAGGSSVVADNYVKKGQNTIYFEKFNVVYTNSLYAHQYMTNVQAAMSEGTNMGKAYTDKNQAFVFRIPVYQNMPESAVTFADKGNPNNWLSSITVDGYALTPAFSGANTSYSLVVPDSAASINVGATAVAGTSTVSGTGNYSLNYGDNTIQITCISQSGDSRTYTLIVARAGGSAGGTIQVADDAAITPFYPIGTYVTGIEPGTSASTVASGIGTQNCTVKILNADGSENTQTVGTGNKLAVYVGDTLVQQYEIVVYGDINGDGKVSNLDLVLMQKQILGIESQSGSRLEAANVSKDGGISNKDLVILQKHILGISQIDQ